MKCGGKEEVCGKGEEVGGRTAVERRVEKKGCIEPRDKSAGYIYQEKGACQTSREDKPTRAAFCHLS